jgi:hypothetical protein
MSGVGAYLSGRRAALGLSAQRVAADLRIPPGVLRALEEDRLLDLAPAAHVRGLVRAYCQRLGEPPDEALRRYAAQRDAGGLPGARLPVATGHPGPTPAGQHGAGRVARRASELLVLAGALAVTGAALQVLGRLGGGGRPAASPGDPRAGGPDGTGCAREPRGRVLVLRADEATWVRVLPEPGRVSEALLPPGTARRWWSAGRFRVTVGNAGGVRAELDGAPLPALGARGQLVRGLVLPPEPPR